MKSDPKKRAISKVLPLLAALILMTVSPLSVFAASITEIDSQHPVAILKVDGKYVFCVEYGVAITKPYNDSYEPETYVDAKKDILSQIAFYGFNTTDQTYEDYAQTQVMIWDELGQINLSDIDKFEIPNYNERKTKIMELVNKHDTFPSWNNQTITIEAGASKTLEDTNGVFDTMKIITNLSNADLVRDGNTLTITPKTDAAEGTITFQKIIDENDIGTSIAYRKNGSQTLVEFYLDDPKEVKVNFKPAALSNEFSIKKLNERAVLEEKNGYVFDYIDSQGGAVFVIEDETQNVIQTSTVDIDSLATFENVPVGTFYLKEVKASSDDYILSNRVYRVESTINGVQLYDDQMPLITTPLFETPSTVFELKNDLKKGKVKLTKTDVSTSEALPDTGIQILDNNQKIVVEGRTNERGVFTFDKLPKGIYYFQEYDAPKGYQIDETPIQFEIREDGEVIEAEITNEKSPIQPNEPGQTTPPDEPNKPSEPNKPNQLSPPMQQGQPSQTESGQLKQSRRPVTGDDSNITLLVITMVLAIGTVAFCYRRKVK